MIAEENQLRYNGMLISVFELLADARDQISDRHGGHWTRSSSSGWPMPPLQASVIGRPTNTTLVQSRPARPACGDAGH